MSALEPTRTTSTSRQLRAIAVYCSSSTSVDEAYFDAARHVGRSLAEQGLRVVYGGGRVGLMGAMADAALAAGGEVIGVITDKLQSLEVGHSGLTELYVVQSMQSRKTMMAQLSDAFIALPGGLGTLEELFEVAVWTQLNYHLKPVALLNTGGYYDELIAFLIKAGDQGFIRPAHRGLIQISDSIEAALHQLRTVDLPIMGTWRP